MKRLTIGILLISFLMICTGMAGVGGVPEGTVPETDVNIQVKLTDRAGVTTTLSQFSMDGKILLKAQHGRGILAVPLQNVLKISFGEIKGNEINAEVDMKSGDTTNLTVNPRSRFFGSTGYGAFQINAAEVVEIHFFETQ